ncbi:MAG TPA: 50S ribosomal protein L30 [Pseudoclavibacter sp.]|nr:50S ribosomal protein L30 [Pseudoclavibacter sp.]
MADLKVTQTKSEIGGNPKQRNTLRSLGLKRVGDSVVKPDNAVNRGYIQAVSHLVKVEEIA